MPKYHYNVHVISKTDDFSMWVGVTLDRLQMSQGVCLDNTLLGMTAIARARELCPSLKECYCEEWNGGEAVDPVQEFLGTDYEDKMAGLVAAFEPFKLALHKANMTLAVDTRGDYCLTAIPSKPLDGLDTAKILGATIPLSDHDLVSLLN